MTTRPLCRTTAFFALTALASAAIFAQELDAPQPGVTTVTNATGTITQVNYGSGGSVNGFLIGTNLLLTFRGNAPVATLGAVGNSVTYSGTEFSNSAGTFTYVDVTSFTNTTTKAAWSNSGPQATPPSSYGPTTGVVKQLNYDTTGAIDGFLFLPTGATSPIFVQTGVVNNTALKTALVVGATVSVTGTTESQPASMCMLAGGLTAVDASSLAFGSTTYVLTQGSGNGEGNGPGFGHGGGRH